jgi:hypothetical protein
LTRKPYLLEQGENYANTLDYLVRPGLTIFNGASPPNILVDMEIAVALGAVILILSLVLLLLIFKRAKGMGNRTQPASIKLLSEAFTRGELL